MQRTSFPFEVVVGDDCSTDRTPEIILQYQKKHPDTIRVILQPVNLGLTSNSRQVELACSGKYHAFCEGDDYWIDPLKLQKQADFMEAHPDVSLSFHNAFILNENCAAARLSFEIPPKEILTFADMYQWNLPTVSLMAHGKILKTIPEWRSRIWCGDLLIRMWCAHHGKIGYLDQVMAIYRRHKNGTEVSRRTRGRQAYYETILYTLREFDRETNSQHADLIQREITRMRQEELRQQSGYRYFLLQPQYLILRLKEYAKWINQKRNLWG
jgi:glycosyltransferase involved in cell wall biosynthesis